MNCPYSSHVTPCRRPAGGYRSDSDELRQYWVWGNTLYLEAEKDADDLTLYYTAYWPDVEYETVGGVATVTVNGIWVPKWAELPLLHLTAATCLVPGSIEAARQRNFNMTGSDIGNPIQNARAQQAREHLLWWTSLLGMVKVKDWSAGWH